MTTNQCAIGIETTLWQAVFGEATFGLIALEDDPGRQTSGSKYWKKMARNHVSWQLHATFRPIKSQSPRPHSTNYAATYLNPTPKVQWSATMEQWVHSQPALCRQETNSGESTKHRNEGGIGCSGKCGTWRISKMRRAVFRIAGLGAAYGYAYQQNHNTHLELGFGLNNINGMAPTTPSWPSPPTPDSIALLKTLSHFHNPLLSPRPHHFALLFAQGETSARSTRETMLKKIGRKTRKCRIRSRSSGIGMRSQIRDIGQKLSIYNSVRLILGADGPRSQQPHHLESRTCLCVYRYQYSAGEQKFIDVNQNIRAKKNTWIASIYSVANSAHYPIHINPNISTLAIISPDLSQSDDAALMRMGRPLGGPKRGVRAVKAPRSLERAQGCYDEPWFPPAPCLTLTAEICPAAGSLGASAVHSMSWAAAIDILLTGLILHGAASCQLFQLSFAYSLKSTRVLRIQYPSALSSSADKKISPPTQQTEPSTRLSATALQESIVLPAAGPPRQCTSSPIAYPVYPFSNVPFLLGPDAPLAYRPYSPNKTLRKTGQLPWLLPYLTRESGFQDFASLGKWMTGSAEKLVSTTQSGMTSEEPFGEPLTGAGYWGADLLDRAFSVQIGARCLEYRDEDYDRRGSLWLCDSLMESKDTTFCDARTSDESTEAASPWVFGVRPTWHFMSTTESLSSMLSGRNRKGDYAQKTSCLGQVTAVATLIHCLRTQTYLIGFSTELARLILKLQAPPFGDSNLHFSAAILLIRILQTYHFIHVREYSRILFTDMQDLPAARFGRLTILALRHRVIYGILCVVVPGKRAVSQGRDKRAYVTQNPILGCSMMQGKEESRTKCGIFVSFVVPNMLWGILMPGYCQINVCAIIISSLSSYDAYFREFEVMVLVGIRGLEELGKRIRLSNCAWIPRQWEAARNSDGDCMSVEERETI
ncbi:uncharacterized protein BDR25DRAFT_358509 [Lindgomyces ingoldianus]|uniref:Uncharacterized protein n=1 Tax=Lindgomyces ingoldianus TaxID=673940 RepID=A0ACB6QKI1_9PLEO|nr:uncharacterized protein BDR25DRAFT_358509 [Lindgomyces ingoldianus]KAF2467396.1 hypothetical protein BDR25DRAFT_358509 [Lindgomyces ingoldianus]